MLLDESLQAKRGYILHVNSSGSVQPTQSDLSIGYSLTLCTVERQWREHFLNHENLFETRVFRANES